MRTKKITIEKLKNRMPIRRFLQWLSKVAFWALTDLRIEGEENFPSEGPLLMVGNHFSMVDIAAFVRVAPYPVEFIGGAVFANAPKFIAFLPRMWGYLPVYRGTGSHFALKEAEIILSKKGILAIFPEGGSHGRMLRPPRPGSAFLAARTKARILPIGLIGMDEVFSSLGKFKRPKVIIRVGSPIGPFDFQGRGRRRRKQLDVISEQMMRRIANLIPPEKHGYLSKDPEIRDSVVEYPWGDSREGEVEAMNVR
jgi:1-acyl-sn-glycerol-3-phosphate acyltransferase